MRAAEWVARLGGSPLSEDETRALRHWLDEDPEHRAAFDEASSTWRDLSALRHEPGPLRELLPTRRRGSARQRIIGIGAFVGLALLAAGAARFQFGDLWLWATADHHTAPGELRKVTLSDGSSVELGPSTAIEIAFDERERRVKFLAGEAFFAVAPRTDSEPRPFVVEAAGGTTTALGTQFVVEAEAGGAEVLAIEHQIEVALSENGTRHDVLLSPGQEVHYAAGRGIGPVQARNVATATAWRRGMLVFDGAQLRHVVETLNRYRRGRIVILDEKLARRRVSGVFATDDLRDAIETITAELGIGSRSIYPLITVLY